MLEYIILGILEKESLTGYDIRKRIEQGIEMFYKASYGSLYPLLGRLSENDYVTCMEIPQGKRIRKVYCITDLGKSVFLEWLSAPIEGNSSTEAFMAKVYFYDCLPPSVAFARIQEYKILLENYRNHLLKLSENFTSLPNQDCFYYKLSTLYFGISKIDSLLHWTEIVINRIHLSEVIH